MCATLGYVFFLLTNFFCVHDKKMVLPSSEEEEEFAQSYSWNKYTGKNCYENLESIDAFNAWNAWSLDEDDYADVCKNRCETTAGCNVAKFMRGSAPNWAKNWKKCTLYKTLPAFTDATTCQNYNKFDTTFTNQAWIAQGRGPSATAALL